MSHNFRQVLARFGVGWLLVCVFASTLSLVWLAYQAISEWRRSAAMLAQRRAEAAVDLLVVGSTRDMRRVQGTVLASLKFDEPEPDMRLDPYQIGSAFARYPYPEAFFVSFGQPTADSMTFYVRGDRRPVWLPSAAPAAFPVTFSKVPGIAHILLDRIAQDVANGRRFATFDIELHGIEYQVVALLLYSDLVGERLKGIVGFVVNLDWVKQNYLRELAAQVLRIRGGIDTGLTLSIHDADGVPLVETPEYDGDAPSSTRQFPMLFFDPALIALDPPADLSLEMLTARVTAFGEPTLVAAQLGARRTLAIAAVSALFLIVSYVLTVRAARANTRLMAMRSDFVAAVTHELKTPIATIRAISETLASGRLRDQKSLREYAQLSVNEAKRLTRLIDNLLAYARITDVTEAYSFEPLAVATIAGQSLKDFQAQLSTQKFALNIDIPDDLPLVRVDRPSMVLALSNLLDNAIRYSNSARRLRVAAFAQNGSVVLEVADAGSGIPDDEIEHVTRKFFRGRGALSGGSGLGLSIAQRIVADHDGTLSVRSEVDVGTTVSITLPGIRVNDEEAHIDS